jgi:phage protein D
VKAYAWDPATQSILETDGTDPAIDFNGNIPSSDLAAVIGLERLDLRHTGLLPQEELQAWADAEFLKKQLAKVRGRVGFMGYPDINRGFDYVGRIGRQNEWEVYVSGIRHEISNGTWKTVPSLVFHRISFTQTYSVNQSPASECYQLFRVCDRHSVTTKKDPDGEDRILVKLQ